ncbi:MAG TPA: CPBP family intramembrane glutamic endopeptidase [Mycobacteriales bacterium]|nr:CPBP family intramembrane glutamic endopeptidase [Mycobacteriales bacterium]
MSAKSAVAAAYPGARRSDVLLCIAGLTGLATSVVLRVGVAGVRGAASVPAGLVFGVTLSILASCLGFTIGRPTRRDVLLGLGTAAALCITPAIRALDATGHAARWSGFPMWAAVVTFVAVAEELMLRGALFEAARRCGGAGFAVALSAIAFGLLHVPVYGWRVLPLDVAVGALLGALRLAADTVWAPACCHVCADLAGWWLR